MNAVNKLDAGGKQTQPRHTRGGVGRVLRRPVAAASLVYLGLLVVSGAMAAQLAPYSPRAQDVVNALQGPSAEHWLGTDTLGRDVLSRMLYGIEPTFLGALQALVVFLALGVPLGILAGYGGGRIDAVINRVAELVLSIPPIIIVLVVLVVFTGSTTAAMLCLGLLGAPGLIRVVRAAAATVREELYVTAARVSGVRTLRIMRTHVLRRVRGPVLVQASLFLGIALVFQSALGFLGLTSEGNRPTWGSMVGEAAGVIVQSSWLLVPPGVAITLAVLAFGFLGDVARDLSSDEDANSSPVRRSVRRRTSAAPGAERGTEPSTAGLLEVRGLTIVTTSDVPLVTDVTFDVQAGGTVGLVGESGCGKSVTALSVLGLLPSALHNLEGSVIFDGVDLTRGGKQAYRTVRGRGLAYISQDPMAALDPTHSIGSHLEEVIALHGHMPRSRRRGRAVELLEQVRINDPARVLRSYPHQISGGMAQRVSIALALAGRPRLLVADEPTTALDVTVQGEILALLRDLQDTTGLAILLITHDWGVVADICDRAVVMYAGEVVEKASVDRIFTSPGHPYTAGLLAADVSAADASPRLPTLPGRVPAAGDWPVGCRFAARCWLAVDACRVEPIPVLGSSDGDLARCIRTDVLRERAGTGPRGDRARDVVPDLISRNEVRP